MKSQLTAWASISAAFVLGLFAAAGLSGCQEAKTPTPPAPVAIVEDPAEDPAIEELVDAPKPSEEPNPQDPQPEEPAGPQSADIVAADAATTAVDKSANAQIVVGDWAQLGGSSYRNNVPIGKDIPIDWDVGGFDRKTGEWKKDAALNIKWVSPLGSITYGNPVVAGGRVFVGTNNGSGYLKRYPNTVDLGCLLCFDEKSGEFLWQHSSEKLSTGRENDYPLQGICCAPLVEGDKLWFVTSRGEVCCLDIEGYYDGEDDGEVQNELGKLFRMRGGDDSDTDPVKLALSGLAEGKLTDDLKAEFAKVGVELTGDAKVTTGERSWTVAAKVGDADRQFIVKQDGSSLTVAKRITPADKREADTIWVFDMMTELGIWQHNMCSCSVTALGDVLFVNTSNGVNETHIELPAPDAPSFIAMDKSTGKVLWTDKSPGVNILHGQWSSPAVGKLGGVSQVIFSGGDGWVYSFQADGGKGGKPTLLWKFDANPKDSKWLNGGRGTRNNIIATPVICDGLVYVTVGQDPENGEGEGHLWCLDPTKRGDVSSQLAVKEDARDTIIEPRRMQAVIAEQGEVAIDNPNSSVVWHYTRYDQNGDGEYDFEEEMHRSCGTVAIKNDLLFIADFSGLFHCLDAKTGKVHWTYDMFAAAWSSALIVENHVYIGDEDGDVAVFDLTTKAHEPIAEINMGNSVYSAPIVANNVLFIASKTHLFAIKAADSSEE
ncbi:MAG: PQQ-binding-like beta-propeller repeat protein [Pirellulaceae bacterium]|nr:PQQ-binding-like beta-propeller repeat protein [Pirellulaceae bacterium]